MSPYKSSILKLGPFS